MKEELMNDEVAVRPKGGVNAHPPMTSAGRHSPLGPLGVVSPHTLRYAYSDLRLMGRGHPMTIRRHLFILALIANTASAAAQDDLVAAGEKVFVKCKTCHLVGPPTKIVKSWPHLNDLFGRKPGSLPDIKYSKALVAFGQDKVWDEATLTIFLRDPQGVVKGTKMAFFGLQKDEEIKAVIAYLATFDKGGMAPK
jgi:cytochrome c